MSDRTSVVSELCRVGRDEAEHDGAAATQWASLAKYDGGTRKSLSAVVR